MYLQYIGFIKKYVCLHTEKKNHFKQLLYAMQVFWDAKMLLIENLLTLVRVSPDFCQPLGLVENSMKVGS